MIGHDAARALRWAVVTVIFALAASAGAEPAPRRASPVLFQGATVHPVSGPSMEHCDVLVAPDGRIAEVGPGIAPPANARIIDATGKVITPGLVDPYTRLGLVGVLAVSGTKDDDAGGPHAVRAAFRAADGFNPANVALAIARAQGLTSVVAAPTGGMVSGQSTWVDLAGDWGDGEVVPGPVAMQFMLDESSIPLLGSSRGAVSLALRELFDDVRFYRDHRALFDENRARTLSASRLDLEALIPVLEGRLPIAAVVRRASDIEAFLDLAHELGLRPIVLGGNEAWLVAARLAEQKVPVVVQPFENLPNLFESLGARSDNAVLLRNAGVPVVISTFHALQFKHDVGTLRQLAGNAVRAGLPWDAALRAVTLAPAELYGRADIGALEPGRRGNLVVWSGDPFELSSVAESVWIDGADQSLRTRQTMLLERYRTLPRRDLPPAPRVLPAGATPPGTSSH